MKKNALGTDNLPPCTRHRCLHHFTNRFERPAHPMTPLDCRFGQCMDLTVQPVVRVFVNLGVVGANCAFTLNLSTKPNAQQCLPSTCGSTYKPSAGIKFIIHRSRDAIAHPRSLGVSKGMRKVCSVQSDPSAIRVEEFVSVGENQQCVQLRFCGVEFGALNRDL
jgi:hypothetical protein